MWCGGPTHGLEERKVRMEDCFLACVESFGRQIISKHIMTKHWVLHNMEEANGG